MDSPPTELTRPRSLERRHECPPLGLLAAIATLLASGAYVFVYLYRWEWNRAQVSAAIFIAAEVGIVGWLLADRMRRVERRLDRAAVDAQQRRLQPSAQTAPPPRVAFAWLARTDRMNVFIPVLLGAGALLSALAWVVERLARATAGRAAERGLAAAPRRARAAVGRPPRRRGRPARPPPRTGADEAGRPRRRSAARWPSSAGDRRDGRADPEPARRRARRAR